MDIISFVVGRFQPFHFGHKKLIDKAIKLANNGTTIIFIGSSNAEESNRNPFNFYKRVDMITKSYSQQELKNIIIVPLPDFEEDYHWVEHIAQCLKAVTEKNKYENPVYRAVVCDKDEDTKLSNNLFEQIYNCEVIRIDNSNIIHATDIRDMIFNQKIHPNDITELPISTKSVVNEFIQQSDLVHSEV